jgi:hypothetical protein
LYYNEIGETIMTFIEVLIRNKWDLSVQRMAKFLLVCRRLFIKTKKKKKKKLKSRSCLQCGYKLW